jgi:outer membrane receptor protein involved in Fe transport
MRLCPLAQLELSGSYTYLDARDTGTDRALDYRSKHSAALDVRVTTWPGGRVAVQGLVRSGQESWYFDAPAAEWVHERLPGFLLLSARVAQEVTFSETLRLEAYVSARNLLDADYVVGSFDPQPGRSVLAGMEMAF